MPEAKSVVVDENHEAHQIATRAILAWHPHLCREHPDEKRAKKGEVVQWIRLCIKFHTDAEPLMLRGYPAAAIAKIIAFDHRQDDRKDAEIKIDFKWWEQADDARRLALMDHELTHFDVQRNDEGFVKCDDLGRPKLKTKHHDFYLGGFDDVCRRHGNAAEEVLMARALRADRPWAFYDFNPQEEKDGAQRAARAEAAAKHREQSAGIFAGGGGRQPHAPHLVGIDPGVGARDHGRTAVAH